MIRCRDGSLYVGATADVARRFAEHAAQGSHCAKYLRGRAPLQLVLVVEMPDKSTALKVEYRLKRKNRATKDRLIKGTVALWEVVCA
ncbi:MAG: GIY-YIG nuclease family protein [Gammaproteobacteria bacterium]